MSQFYRKGGITLNDTEWIQDFADRRLQYGVSQTKLAVMAGISREHLSRIESGKVAVTEEMKVKLLEALEKFNPEAPLTMLFDYVRIRFPTLDIGHIIKDILQLNIQYMIYEDFGHYSYTEHYYIGDIFVYTSPDEEKGVLLELKGKGCRQFESYLLAQERSWYDFLMDALVDGGVMKRLDLAINDHTGMLDIVEERENRQEQRTQKRNLHRENISQKKQELQKAQEARQTVHANGSATAGATRSHKRPVATPVPKTAQTDTVIKPDMKRPATSPVIKNAEIKAGKETVRTNIRQEQQVKSVAKTNQPNVAETISNHKKSTVQKTQVNGKSARKTVTKHSENWPVQAKTALCEMCDCAYRYDRRDGKTSENNDGYSVSYDMNKTLNVMLYEIAEVYLINTGLLSLAVDDDVNECNDNCL